MRYPRFNKAAANRCRSPYHHCTMPALWRASIRLQRIAADHDQRAHARDAVQPASIRLQRIAADHCPRNNGQHLPITGFNKAAANRCRSPPARSDRAHSGRRFNKAAANRCRSRRPVSSRSTRSPCFNKAAANRCRSLHDHYALRPASRSFNKAAANRCRSPFGVQGYPLRSDWLQ